MWKEKLGLDSKLFALIAARINSAHDSFLPYFLLQLPTLSLGTFCLGDQIFRLAPCCESNGRKMKNDSKALTEKKSLIALFMEGERN